LRKKTTEEAETPAASLTAVKYDDGNDGDNDANTLAWEGFMIPVVDEESMEVLTVVVEETEIEAPLPPTLRIRGRRRSSERDSGHGEWKLDDDDTVEA